MKTIELEKLSGVLPRKNLRLVEAKKYLSTEKSEYVSPESLTSSDKAISDYHSLFDKGADIYPRNLWFVSIPKHDLLSLNPEKPFVETDAEIVSKPPWDKVSIHGTVERRFLFATALGDDVIPFAILHFKPVVLPIALNKGRVSIIKGSKAAMNLGYSGLSDYLTQVEHAWNRHAKSKKLGLYDWLDFRRKLTNQHPNRAYKVLYTGSATYLTAAVVKRAAGFKVPIDGSFLALGDFIAESKTYVYETDDEDEAFYLCAILNSGIVDHAIKPLQTRGLWGARDIHKRPLLLPIPHFEKNSSNHVSLAREGKSAYNRIIKSSSELSTYKSIGKARSIARSTLGSELKKIDELVSTLFLKSKSGLLKFTS